jgi:hypothetical protein
MTIIELIRTSIRIPGFPCYSAKGSLVHSNAVFWVVVFALLTEFIFALSREGRGDVLIKL